MPDPTRDTRRVLTVGGVCLAVMLVLAPMAAVGWDPLVELDQALGRAPFQLTTQTPWLLDVLRAVESAFGTVALTAYTVLLAGGLLVRRQPRAALWSVLVMAGAALTVSVLKPLLGRQRPDFEDPLRQLSTFAFPSGHASGVASAMGVAVILTLVFVRQRRLRRGLVALWVVVGLLVGADRILLGVHHVTDVVGGYATGILWVCMGLLVYHPAPRQRRAHDFPSPVPNEKRLAVILNPIKVDDPEVFRGLVRRKAAEFGWSEPRFWETLVDDPGQRMAEEAAVEGTDLVLVCGGDGTVRTVCGELGGTGIPVGVVPAGTGNLLARNLGIPLYLEAAVDTALNGQDRAIDLVAVSGDGIPDDEHFLVMGGMGLDAAIMAGADDATKARIGWLAYFVSGFQHLRYPSLRVEISVDDGPFTRHRARTVVVGNVGTLTAGIPLLPDATIDDGVLDVVLVAPRRFVGWFSLVWRVLSRRRRTDDALNRMTGRTVVIRTGHATPRQLDGDPVEPGREIRAECLHGRLLIRVPR